MRLSRAAACRSIAALCLTIALPGAPAAVSAYPATVLAMAATQPNLSTFVSAIKSAGLESELTGADPVTIFVPTDEAFAKLAQADRDALMAPANRDKLRHILLGHVVKGAFVFHDPDAGDVKDATLDTVGGTTIRIATEGGRTMVASAHLLKADMRAANGRVSTIDRVLLP